MRRLGFLWILFSFYSGLSVWIIKITVKHFNELHYIVRVVRELAVWFSYDILPFLFPTTSFLFTVFTPVTEVSASLIFIMLNFLLLPQLCLSFELPRVFMFFSHRFCKLLFCPCVITLSSFGVSAFVVLLLMIICFDFLCIFYAYLELLLTEFYGFQSLFWCQDFPRRFLCCIFLFFKMMIVSMGSL